jgi:hypothetical protein
MLLKLVYFIVLFFKLYQKFCFHDFVHLRILCANCIFPLGKQPLTRLRRWEDNSGMDLRITGCEREKRMNLAQDCVQWWVFLFVVSDRWVVLPESKFI